MLAEIAVNSIGSRRLPKPDTRQGYLYQLVEISFDTGCFPQSIHGCQHFELLDLGLKLLSFSHQIDRKLCHLYPQRH